MNKTLSYKTMNKKKDVSIAYEQTPGKSPGIIFLPGFMSDMSGTKALYFENFCKKLGHAYTRFDYQGHGASSGQFEDGTLGDWKNDAIEVLDRLTKGPQILVGSSMGGWLMTLVALERKQRIQGLLGIASALDFTEDLLDKLPPQHKEDILKTGVCYVPSSYNEKPYPFTLKLIEEGKEHHLLDKEKSIPIHCMIRLVHGTEDTQVRWQQSLRLLEKVESQDTLLTLVKNGDHRLSSEAHLDILGRTLQDMLRENATVLPFY